MVVVDANVLLYAVNLDAPNHETARRWLERALAGDEPVGFAWLVLLAFVRIATLRAVSPRPLTVEQALDVVEAWLESPAGSIAAPTSRHLAIFRALLAESGTAGNLASDAHLAALAVEHGARVCTFDRDFERFVGITVERPA
jgi:toxin-antitoxin system PIN domain toxin